jgi:lactate dehydrogenase-like 2-hydroxyacid dehydrogenase
MESPEKIAVRKPSQGGPVQDDIREVRRMGPDRPRVLVTRRIPEAPLELLRAHCAVEVNPEDRPLSRPELLEAVRDRDGVLCLLTDRVDGEIFDAASPRCRIFANYAVGFDNLDLAAAIERAIPVTNTPDVLTDATADLAWTLILATARRVVEADRFLRSGAFEGWGPLLLLGRAVAGKTLGIVGAGRIGRAVARRALGFGMRIFYYDSAPIPAFETETGAVPVDNATLLAESDVLSLHVPLLPETRHWIGEAELRAMKPEAVLVNTSRGAVVDEAALARALRERWIFGAGLDVYEGEPRVDPGLIGLDNAVLLPHVASATEEAREAMGFVAVRNILAALRGERPGNCVNPETLPDPRVARRPPLLPPERRGGEGRMTGDGMAGRSGPVTP